MISGSFTRTDLQCCDDPEDRFGNVKKRNELRQSRSFRFFIEEQTIPGIRIQYFIETGSGSWKTFEIVGIFLLFRRIFHTFQYHDILFFIIIDSIKILVQHPWVDVDQIGERIPILSAIQSVFKEKTEDEGSQYQRDRDDGEDLPETEEPEEDA